MDEPFFISRDARCIANDLNVGNAAGAAQRLREDCAHMNPGEFSSLLSQTRANEMPGHRADLEFHRDGIVTVRAMDGNQFAAGQLPPVEVGRFCPPPPVVEVVPAPVIVQPHDRLHIHVPHLNIDIRN